MLWEVQCTICDWHLGTNTASMLRYYIKQLEMARACRQPEEASVMLLDNCNDQQQRK